MWNPPNDAFFDTVWLIVKQIPVGKVSTYGQIASMMPPSDDYTPDDFKRLAPRWVGTALRNVSDSDVPWQRVINSQGKISLAGATGDKQRRLLEDEGVVFTAANRVMLSTYGWDGPDDAWLDEYDLLPPNTFGNHPTQKPLF